MPMPLFIKPAGFGVAVVEQPYGFDFYVEDWVSFAMSGIEIEVNGIVFYTE
ncbi:hypothetical protein H6F86_20740 [Phormidium sp. FACHB-592]|uniref:Uncharacterized protein n=1 Tax=Stenomitos frigidus AS-A4 TaxID=2933935 RepID=A0ABV0KEK6_9CYAN|nr:hypothetical protein [Phormidium sp. FACHB-592]MBD2076261.1 hypothetical protein [Phormidium sp. FACHB-592]